MSTTPLTVRRATVEDLPALKAMWTAHEYDADQLETRLTEFQVVEREGEILGAIGFLILRTAGLLHNEEYSDYSIADEARALFWDRIQKLASTHGVFRLWLRENTPYWLRWGFQPPDAETLERLPIEWNVPDETWFTFELKNEAVITAALNRQFAGFMASEKRSVEETQARAKQVMNIFTVICFLIFFICLAVAGWLVMRRHQ
jgi:N-acetylglutamate synthase-like GNAT family acetyltransferase